VIATAEEPLAEAPPDRELDPDDLGDHIHVLYRAAWALTGHREDAEDLVQETYARVLARPRLVRRDSNLRYLLRALRNTYVSRLRDQGRRIAAEVLEDEPKAVSRDAASSPEAALEARHLYAAVAALRPEFRDVIVAVDVAGLSYREAARALGTREGTVMSRLYRGRQRVAEALTA
jgi:RNA polymerase sigma-70 factor, ECF subfamily